MTCIRIMLFLSNRCSSMRWQPQQSRIRYFLPLDKMTKTLGRLGISGKQPMDQSNKYRVKWAYCVYGGRWPALGLLYQTVLSSNGALLPLIKPAIYLIGGDERIQIIVATCGGWQVGKITRFPAWLPNKFVAVRSWYDELRCRSCLAPLFYFLCAPAERPRIRVQDEEKPAR